MVIFHHKGSKDFIRGPGCIQLSSVDCVGPETAFPKCPAQPWGAGSCHSGEDASAVCSGNPSSGHVQHWEQHGASFQDCFFAETLYIWFSSPCTAVGALGSRQPSMD